LKAFQNEVWKEYRFYRATIESQVHFTKDYPENIEKSWCGILSGWFFSFWKWFFGGLIERGNKKMAQQKNFEGFEKEAYEIRKEPEIRKEICHTIASLNRYEVLTEEKFIRILTASVAQPDLVKKFVIPANAVLYGIIAYQVFHEGLENYCNEKNN
jgi:hypothetical protein